MRALLLPANLPLNEYPVGGLTGDLSGPLESVVATLDAAAPGPAEEDCLLASAVQAWNAFGERAGSFADEHSTL